MINKVDIAWTSGILEGEAYFGYKSISVEMTDLDVLEKLQNLWGGTITIQRIRNEKWKQSWRWYLGSRAYIKLLILVRDFMMSRRTIKIDEIIAYQMMLQEKKLDRKEITVLAAQAYVNGEGSTREIQKRYGVSYETIRKHAAITQSG